MKILQGFIGLILFTCIIPVKGFSQIEEAKKISWDIDSTTSFKASRDNVWDLLKDLSKWNEISDGYIARVDVKKVGYNMKMTLVFADSSRRTDMVTQYQPEYRFIVIEAKEPLPAGVTENTFTVVVNALTENSCTVKFGIRAEGDEVGRTQLLKELKREMVAILSGLNKKLSAAN
jgi:hypothetical protein